jgi:uncharacterized membrane protein
MHDPEGFSVTRIQFIQIGKTFLLSGRQALILGLLRQTRDVFLGPGRKADKVLEVLAFMLGRFIKFSIESSFMYVGEVLKVDLHGDLVE